MFNKTIISLACCQILAVPAVAFAADDDTTGADSLSLGEMVVTTRKREETLQEVPIAITAFSAELIEDADLQSIEDIALMTPGFTYTPLFGGNVGNPVIRGANTTIGEPNVGFFIDGVYQSSRGTMESLFGDELERIEVAKGPQSALYGRNTFAGAINYITKQPSNEGEGKLELTLGNEGRKDVRFFHSGAITEDTLFYRVGGMHSSFDGFYKNDFDGSDLDDKQSNIYSLSLVALPTDDLEVVFRVAVENTNDGDDGLQFVDNNIKPSVPLGGAFLFAEGNVPTVDDDFAVTPGSLERDNITTSLRVDWDLDQMTFTSITGYNDLETDEEVDDDYTTADLSYLLTEVEQEEISQEFRLTSVDQSIRWMAGLYFYDLDTDTSVNNALSAAAPVVSEASTKNAAIFGSLGFDLTDQLALTVSTRYSYEKKELDANDASPAGFFKGSETFNHFTPKVALDYQLTDDALIYGSIAKAVKSGGFNTTVRVGRDPTPEERAYDEEESINYEIGVKTAWLDNRVTANLAIFYIKWDDQIVRALGDAGAIINDNVGESTSKGFEFELSAKPAQNWDVMLGLAYTDSQYDEYTLGALAGFPFNTVGADPVLDGNPSQFVSDWTANASVQYTKPFAIAGFEWKTRADVLYQDEQPIQAFDDVQYIPDRTIVNLRSGLENDKYEVTVWVKNLFDDDGALSGLILPNPGNFGLFQGVAQAPEERTYGITASVKF